MTEQTAQPLRLVIADDSTCSRFDAAEHHFERALEMNTQMGARPASAHTQHDYSLMLLTRDEGEDRSRARELMTAALNTYRDLGMTGWAEKARALT
jgi:hypothetical protein